jgi:hypothetical protein
MFHMHVVASVMLLSLPLLALASTTFGLVTQDTVLLSSSCEFSPGGTVMKSDMNWIHPLGSSTLVALQGDPRCERRTLTSKHAP